MSKNDFTSLSISQNILKSIEQMGFSQMTPVQEQALPIILNGDDLVAKSKTGSGKTLAFGIGLLEKLKAKEFYIQSLVICPTRELSEQVAGEIRKLARFENNVKVVTLCGGEPLARQQRSLQKGAHIVVGTPGRIIDHIGKESIELLHVKTLVLDEADRMLDMGFLDDVKYIRSKLAPKVQTLLFSATFPKEIEQLVLQMMDAPKTVTIQEEEYESYLEQFTCKVKEKEKYEALKIVLLSYKPSSSIVFCNTKIEVEQITQKLYEDGFDADYFHGGLEQNVRNEILLMFANGSIPILVTTNLAARGLDIKDVELVINYDFPQDAEVYLHRVGRTARAGERGTSISLYMENERKYLDAVEVLVGEKIKELNLTELKYSEEIPYQAKYVTLHLFAGKKDKIRPGDIVGTFIQSLNVDKDALGNIDILHKDAYVAVTIESYEQNLTQLKEIKIKGKRIKIVVI